MSRFLGPIDDPDWLTWLVPAPASWCRKTSNYGTTCTLGNGTTGALGIARELALVDSARQDVHVTALAVDESHVLWHRLRVNNLAERLSAGSFTRAAFAGLQDSAPRAAVVSLAARVDAVGSGDWDDPSLVQTWAPRGAVFVVPRHDLGVFARGIMPRDPAVRTELEPLVEKARRTLLEPRVMGEEANMLGPIPAPVAAHLRRRPVPRLVFAMAGIQVRWDVRKTYVLPSPPVEIDQEDARRELARRFLHSLGPARPQHFSRWAAITRSDAGVTFEAIAKELVEVEWSNGSGLVLAPDVETLLAAEPVAGVRFLAFGGDPVLQPGDDVVLAENPHRRSALPPWASMGLILVDARVVGSWGRSGSRIGILAFLPLSPRSRDDIEREALSLPATGPPPSVVWR